MIDRISNELEFSLYNVSATDVISSYGAQLVHEVNPRDVVELNVSLAQDVAELNQRLSNDVKRLVRTAESLGGSVYGGSSLLADVSDVEPRWYRTTSMSRACAHGLLDITSQQVVIGVSEERFGFDLYNYFRNINPVLVALSASSPYVYEKGSLARANAKSRRVGQYRKICDKFPVESWKDMPELRSLEEHKEWLQSVSGEVNRKLESGSMDDANWDELLKVRKNGNGGFSYYPFGILEPHQVYCSIRVRPDHRNIEKGGKSLFSLELRVPDMPATIEGMQMLNAFVAGLALYASEHGTKSLPTPFTGDFEDLEAAAVYGMDAEINNRCVRKEVGTLREYATRGLEESGHGYETKRFDRMEGILSKGNDADIMMKLAPSNVTELRSYLIGQLRNGD